MAKEDLPKLSAEFRPTQICQWVRRESVVELSWEVGQVEAAHDCRIESFCPPCVGRGKYHFKCPNKNSKIWDPARTSTGRSGSDMDRVFVDGDVAKVL